MPVATAKMFGSKMMSSGGKPTSSGEDLVGARADRDLALERVGLALLVEGHDDDGGAVGAADPAPAPMNVSSPSFMEIEFTIGLPWMHFRPASMTWNFEESTITGTRAMSGSPATRLRNSTIAFSESSRPSSMLTSMICAPFATWSRATSSAAAKSPLVTSLRNLAEPVTLVRSPTLTNGMSLVSVNGSSPDSRISGGISGTGRGALPATAAAIARICVRRRAAAAADDVDEAGIGELGEHRGGRLRALVVEAELVRQAGIRIGADERVGDLARSPGYARASRARRARS